MDPATQVRFNISGSRSGNTDSNNTFGSHNTIGKICVNNFGVVNQNSGFGKGDGACRPYQFIPYGRNRTFTGRKDLIASLKRFSELEGHNRVALHGLGGSGKTQTALEFVYQCASVGDRDIFWVQGSGVFKFREGFRGVAQHAQIPLAGSETNEEGSLLGVRRWFEGPYSGDWILVVDNADNDADFIGNNGPIAKFIPQGTKGTVVYTTRSRQVALRQGCKMIEVGKMGEEEAEELFSKRFDSWHSLEDKEKKVVARILDSVHHLPLAVVGSAAFMAETETPPSVYWSIFQQNEERAKKLLSQPFCDIQREVDMTESILSTYFITFDRIADQVPPAADLLRLIAFFDRQRIPEELLSQCGLEGMDDLVEFRMAIGKLLGLSLVTTVKSEDGTFYELHRLVQLSLQVYLPAEELKKWKATALRVISRLFPRSENERRYRGPAYIQHALAVTKDSADPIAEELGYQMGQYFLDIGSYSDAEIQFRQCISLRKRVGEYDWDEEGHKRFRLLGLASTYLGKANVAEKIFRDLLESIEKRFGPNNSHVLLTIKNLAEVLRHQGKYSESEVMNGRALEDSEKVLGPDHPDTLTSINNLAIVLECQGKYDESEAINRQALEGREKVLGSDHPDTLASVNSLALVLRRRGKHDESEVMNRRALEGREKVLGSDHPDTLTSINNLAMVMRHQGKYQESEMIGRRALEGREKALGPNHPDTLKSVNDLAIVLRRRGKYDESETTYRRALEGQEKVLRPDHPNTLTTLSNLGLVLQSQEKYDESETTYRRALEGQEKVLGPDHPSTLITVNNLGLVLELQGKYDESETTYRRALEGLEKVLGPDHPNTLTALNNLGWVLQLQEKYDESETTYRRALEGQEKVLGPDHPNTLTTLNNLGWVLQLQERYDESETTYRRALEGKEKVLGPNHPSTLITASNLASMPRQKH